MRLFVALFCTMTLAPVPPGSFSTAKKRAMEITEGHRTTLYCGCPFDETKDIQIDECAYRPQDWFTKSGNINPRIDQVEWEHVVAASRMGRGRTCWENRELYPTCEGLSSRSCCRRVDPKFRAMENDLHNLWPAVGELNGDRSNREFGYVAGEPREYGECDFEVSKTAVEPPDEVRGEIARSYLYMAKVHGLPLTSIEQKTFHEWNLLDPPTEWELERDRRIAKVQQNHNPFVVNHPRVHNGKVCTPRHECCRVCSRSQACGDGCISRSKSCQRDPGCACDATNVCP